MRLAALCRKIEFDGREGRADELVAQVGEARQVWDETVAAMTAAGMVP
jgi:hypothetical protein